MADAHLILGYISLFRCTKNEEYLNRAQCLGQDLDESSIKGYTGKCWGYPFDWQNSSALWKKGTPYMSVTPYCFEAFRALYEVTGIDRYAETA